MIQQPCLIADSRQRTARVARRGGTHRAEQAVGHGHGHRRAPAPVDHPGTARGREPDLPDRAAQYLCRLTGSQQEGPGGQPGTGSRRAGGRARIRDRGRRPVGQPGRDSARRDGAGRDRAGRGQPEQLPGPGGGPDPDRVPHRQPAERASAGVRAPGPPPIAHRKAGDADVVVPAAAAFDPAGDDLAVEGRLSGLGQPARQRERAAGTGGERGGDEHGQHEGAGHSRQQRSRVAEQAGPGGHRQQGRRVAPQRQPGRGHVHHPPLARVGRPGGPRPAGWLEEPGDAAPGRGPPPAGPASAAPPGRDAGHGHGSVHRHRPCEARRRARGQRRTAGGPGRPAG